MEFLNLAKERYSVRKFKSKQVPHDVVDKILEAAQVAPTACNNQPIKIYVLESESSRNKMKNCTNCHFDAPLIMMVCYDSNLCWNRPFDNKNSGDVDASIVTTHIILEAYSLGIGTTWVMYFDPSAVTKEFDLPKNIIPVSVIPMGYPADDCKPSQDHSIYKNINDIVEKK